MVSRRKKLVATVVTEKGAVLREQYQQLTTAEIESVVQRMQKGGAFPEFDRYCANDEDAMSHAWFALAIDPTGVVRARGAAAHRADAAALAWIHACVDPEKPSSRQVLLEVPMGWSFKCVTVLGEDDDDAHQAHSSPAGAVAATRGSGGRMDSSVRVAR
jgi:hypothetical protein